MRLHVRRVPHGGKGAAVRAGMLAATGDLVVFTDADMATPPDQIPFLLQALADHDVALGSRIQPDGSDMRATPAGLPPTARQAVPRARIDVGRRARARTPSAGSRGSAARRRRTSSRGRRVTSIVFDVELIYLARRRGYRMAIVPIRWFDKRGSRMRARPSLAVRVAWDLFRIPLIHRGSRRSATERA